MATDPGPRGVPLFTVIDRSDRAAHTDGGEDASITLSVVVSNITGASAWDMLTALVAGNTTRP